MTLFKPTQWKEYSKELPWICGLMTYNSEMTIYETFRFANKMFDYIIVTDDGSTDATIKEIERFISDYNCKNILGMSVADWDPIPSLKVGKDHGVSNAPVTKTISKARLKNFEISKRNFPHSIYFALEDDVIVDIKMKDKISNKISIWEDPLDDCEYFNVVNIINKDWLRLSNPDPAMIRRKSYDNSGDWTFACWYTSGNLNVVPDPGVPYGPCLWPWIEKNQIGKKGKNTDSPYGYHFLYYRKNRDGFVLEDGTKRIINIKECNDSNLNTKLIDKVNFKTNIEVKISNDVSTLKVV